MKVVAPRKPNIHLYHPDWCHHHGAKMVVVSLDPLNEILVIAGSAAKVTIQKASCVFPGKQGWFVDWEVVQCRPLEEGARGRVLFSDADLAAAFGLSDRSGKFGGWLIARYGADVAEQGKYIRWQQFLNIPCPGTGHDGDPNVSIHIDGKIRDAVCQLLRNK